MYSKLVIGLAMAGAASAAEIVRRDTAGGGGHAHGGGGHDHGSSSGGHASAPADSYGAPAASSSYSAPSTGYSQPSGGYGAPATGYGQEASYGGDDYHDFDLTVIIIPILILIGLSLLFPGIVNVAVRKRREAEEVSPLTDAVERVNDIYMAVVESEECMERIACEIGGLATDVGLKQNSLAKMADPFVPSKYKAYYKQFKTGQNCHKIKCGSIF